MLFLGRQRARNCQSLSRRSFLQVGGSTVLGLCLADLLKLRAHAGSPQGTAKSVILVWLWGGPSHLDTWDPKPAAPLDFRGPFNPIATSVPGTRICELFPNLARIADSFSIIRSMHTESNDHGIAGTIGLTGSSVGGLDLGGQMRAGTPRPATGSVVARIRGSNSRLPPFVVVGGRLHQGKKVITGEGGGTLGAVYDPFRLECNPEGGFKIPALQLPAELTPERLGDRETLMKSLDGIERKTEELRKSRAIDGYRSQAFSMLTAPEARNVFDLSGESQSMADRYGRTRFGQSCLLARRLVERGVPYVQVNWSDHVEAEEDSGDGGWDHHYRNFQIMQDRHAPWLDQSLSALLSDLRDRGLLSSTLVIVMGEFGRSPKINDKAGRDHWEHGYSALLAGGGVQGGRVIGSSDAKAERPRDYPITPTDISATVKRLVGISSEQAALLGLSADGNVIEALL